jgi:hypothetical protein
VLLANWNQIGVSNEFGGAQKSGIRQNVFWKLEDLA